MKRIKAICCIIFFYIADTVTCRDSPHVDFVIRLNQHSKFLETSKAATKHDTGTRPSNENCRIAVWPSDSIQRDSLLPLDM